MDLNRLQKAQNSCIKLLDPKQTVDMNYINNNIMTIPQLIKLEEIKLGYKITNKLLPTNLQSLLDTDQKGYALNKNHAYNTHKKRIPNQPRVSTKTYSQSFLNKGISSYSMCSDLLRSKLSYQLLVACYKRDIMNQNRQQTVGS